MQKSANSDWKTRFNDLARNSLVLDIGGREQNPPACSTHFGGNPDVPSDFVWPCFEGAGFEDDAVLNRPLSFLAQFNCQELAPLDADHMLPDHGVLSFFYELEAMPWGFSPRHRGGGRVFWFEDTDELAPCAFPEDLREPNRLPCLNIRLTPKLSLPTYEDAFLRNGQPLPSWTAFTQERTRLCGPEPDCCSRLLGWPDIIQGSMFRECELVSNNWDLGHGIRHIPRLALESALSARKRWSLLFQLDTVTDGDFQFTFGDCGRIFFLIRNDDLRQRRFDRTWLILQCS